MDVRRHDTAAEHAVTTERAAQGPARKVRRGHADGLAAWAWPGATLAGVRDAGKESERADPSEPILKHGDIREVRLGGRIADGEDVEPVEGLTVKWLTVAQPELWARAVLRQRRVSMHAAALAMMADSPHDVRPHLLLLQFGQVADSIEPCIRYGTAYLRRWRDLCGIGGTWTDAPRCAAADGLALVYWGTNTRGRGRITVDDRAAQLRISKSNYLLLRTKIESVFRVRFAEAVILFERQFRDTELLAPANRYNSIRETENPAGFSEPLRSRAA